MEDWAGGPRKALGLRYQAFAGLIGDLPMWEGEPVPVPSVSSRSEA